MIGTETTVQVTSLGGAESEGQRRAAAEHAVEWVEDGMVLGFGTGRAAGHALEAIAERVRGGLRITGVPSSHATEEKARALNLAITTLDEHPRLDLTIDGADEVDPRGRLIKGAGGALLREKVLAAASERLVIVVEQRKLVPVLGTTRGLPLEVLPFAWTACAEHLRQLGGDPTLRLAPSGDAAVTDNGHWLIDCAFAADAFATPGKLDRAIRRIPGILETGLFYGFGARIVVGEPAGVRVFRQR